MASYAIPKVNRQNIDKLGTTNYTSNPSFTQPPGAAAPRNTAPPAQHPTAAQKPKPVARPAAPQTRVQGLLPTGSKKPFNVFGIPSTQGGFNQQVNQLAASSYQPQLQQNTTDLSAENALNKVRAQDIANIYNTEAQQARQAFKDAQGAITDLITQEKGGNAASQGYLSAALGAAGAPQDQLAGMMGMSPTTTPGTLAPYLSSAAGTAGAVGGNLATQEGGLESQLANAETTPSMARAVTDQTEAQRHQAQLDTLSNNRATIIAGIPAAIQKASEQLMKDIQAGQNSQFQERLAAKQFGETSKVDAANIANQKATQALNKRKTEASIQQGNQQLKNQAQQIANAAAATKANLNIALAKATSTQQTNAIKYLTSWAQPTPQEMLPGTVTKTTDPATGKSVTSKGNPTVNAKTWHRDAGNALETLMTVYGMNLQSALALMSTINVPIGGGQKGTVAQWAKTFLQRQKQNVANGALNSGNRLQPRPQGPGNKTGGAISGAGAGLRL